MTDDELIEKMRERIAAAWGDGRVTRQTYATAGPVEQKRFDACARAALAVARPIIEREATYAALAKAAKMVSERYDGACYEGISRFIAADIHALGDDNVSSS